MTRIPFLSKRPFNFLQNIHLSLKIAGIGTEWMLDSNNVLTISGTGRTDDYWGGEGQPWAAYKNQIEKVPFYN